MNNSMLRSSRHKLTIRSKLFTALALVMLLIILFLLSSSRSANAEMPKAGGNGSDTSRSQNEKVFRPIRNNENANHPHLLAASYYSFDDNLSATLMLSNQGPRPFEVRPTLFSMKGERLDIPPIKMEGNTVRAFDLREWAASGGTDFQEGSLQVFYRGKELELGGVVRLDDASRSLIFDEELTEPAMMFESSRLEGVWWLPSRRCDLRLVVSNTTDSALTVTASVDGITPRQRGPVTWTLMPHETRVVEAARYQRSGAFPLSTLVVRAQSWRGHLFRSRPGAFLRSWSFPTRRRQNLHNFMGRVCAWVELHKKN